MTVFEIIILIIGLLLALGLFFRMLDAMSGKDKHFPIVTFIGLGLVLLLLVWLPGQALYNHWFGTKPASAATSADLKCTSWPASLAPREGDDVYCTTENSVAIKVSSSDPRNLAISAAHQTDVFVNGTPCPDGDTCWVFTLRRDSAATKAATITVTPGDGSTPVSKTIPLTASSS